MAPRRRFLMVANFKSSGTVNDVVDLARSFGATHWEHWGPEEPEDRTAQVVVAPSLLHLHLVREHLGPAARRIELGAQDVYPESGSHHTGEHTVEMLRDSQVNWVILGHSERRRDPILRETNELVAAKARHALGAGMGAIICVGETAEERAHGHAVKVVLSQLEAVASQLSQWDSVAIAYEPVRAGRRVDAPAGSRSLCRPLGPQSVTHSWCASPPQLWAIGTGAVASLDQVQEARSLRCCAAAVMPTSGADPARFRRCMRRCATGSAPTCRR